MAPAGVQMKWHRVWKHLCSSGGFGPELCLLRVGQAVRLTQEGGSTAILSPPHIFPRLLQPLAALHVSGRKCPWQEIFGKRLSSARCG